MNASARSEGTGGAVFERSRRGREETRDLALTMKIHGDTRLNSATCHLGWRHLAIYQIEFLVIRLPPHIEEVVKQVTHRTCNYC